MAEQPPQHLPGFCLRQLQPRPDALSSSPAASRHAFVTMRRRSYDDLVARNPDAVLSYVDDDDGDHVTVGTSFELLQRLEEPLDLCKDQSHLSTDTLMPASHAFDIAPSEAVRRDWQPYVDRSAPPAHPLPTDELYSNPSTLSGPEAAPPSAGTTSPPSGSLTPAGKQQIKEAAAALQRASQNSPHLTEQLECSPHTNRWISYGTLPASFSPPPPSSAAPQPEERSVPVAEGSPAKPLLALFEAELAKLGSGPALYKEHADDASTSTASTVGKTPAGPTPGTTASTAAQTQPNYQSSQTQTTANTTSREVISNSMQTLFDGIGLLRSTSSDVNQELRQLASTVPKDLMDLIRSRVHPFQNTASTNHDPAVAIAKRERRIAEYRKKASLLRADLDGFLDEASPFGNTPENYASVLAEPQLTVIIPTNRRGEPPQCGNDCLKGCSRTTCPVRALVKEAHGRLFPQELFGPQSESSQSVPVPPHFKVDVLLARRYISYDSVIGPRKKQYLVRWVGHGPEADVWYDVESLVHCEELVAKYDRDYPEPEGALLVPRPMSQTPEENLHLAHLHSRAADRMITFQPQTADREALRWDPAARAKKPARPESSHQNEASADTEPQNSAQEFTARKAKPVWAGESQAERLKPLRHQKSWHGSSRPAKPQDDTDSFDFSPMAVMKKYPPVALVDPTTVRAGERLGHRTIFQPHEPKDKPPKAVSFASWPAGVRGVVEPDAAQHVGESSAAPLTDPSLYAPPSPVIPPLRRQSTFGSRDTASPGNDVPETFLRRAKSLNLRAAAPQMSEERTRDRRDRFRPYADPRVRAAERTSTGPVENTRSHVDTHAPRETVNIRRANTTAGAQSTSRRADGLTSRGRPLRDESDTRRDNIAHCRFRLSEMGFPRGEASVVSEAVSGDLESALDILNEDGRARDELERHTKRSRYGYAAHERMQMPGAFPWK